MELTRDQMIKNIENAIVFANPTDLKIMIYTGFINAVYTNESIMRVIGSFDELYDRNSQRNIFLYESIEERRKFAKAFEEDECSFDFALHKFVELMVRENKSITVNIIIWQPGFFRAVDGFAQKMKYEKRIHDDHDAIKFFEKLALESFLNVVYI